MRNSFLRIEQARQVEIPLGSDVESPSGPIRAQVDLGTETVCTGGDRGLEVTGIQGGVQVEQIEAEVPRLEVAHFQVQRPVEHPQQLGCRELRRRRVGVTRYWRAIAEVREASMLASATCIRKAKGQ
ncbi:MULTISPECIES: hypothetical protein [unclassified Thiocapsa]|uniref:hypothetical protein n=1 Tax=unclassified Thiocapsa TaxID=2641286 RepID=UPI0035B0F2AE